MSEQGQYTGKMIPETVDKICIGDATLYTGDVLEVLALLPDESVHCVVTSPPYWGLRDYGTATWEGGDAECEHRKNPQAFSEKALAKSTIQPAAQTGHAQENYHEVCGKCGARRVDKGIGLESTFQMWLDKMVAVMREVKRVMRKDAVCFLNVGDAYASGKGTCHNPGGGVESLEANKKEAGVYSLDRHNKSEIAAMGFKPKDLLLMPARLAIALQADGWWIRSEIVWFKRNPMPESVGSRPTSSHEKIYVLSKEEDPYLSETIYLITKNDIYFYDCDAVREGYAESTVERLSQPTFDSQNGGRKDPKSGNRSCRKALENLKGSWDKVADADRGELIRRGHDKTGPTLTHPNGRNLRNVWDIPTEPYPEAHFATYPQELVRRCIAAGTSEHGCCARCGAQWERVTEKGDRQPEPEHRNPTKRLEPGQAGNVGAGNMGFRASKLSGQEMAEWKREHPDKTLGWRPSCKCGVDTVVPATVLDCFSGSGTTGLVALKLGRRYIGIELSPTYNALALKRIEAEARQEKLEF